MPLYPEEGDGSLVSTLSVDGDRVEEVFVQVAGIRQHRYRRSRGNALDKLQDVPLHTSRHADIVDQREMDLRLSIRLSSCDRGTYDIFAEPNTAGMGTYGDAILSGHEEDREDLVNASETT